MGEKLTDMSELLFRQVHPQFYEGGKLGSRAFKPNSSDGGLMSADRSSIATAESAFEHYTKEMKKKSACVYGIIVQEFIDENIECDADPIQATEEIKENKAHCLADYNKNGVREWKNIAQRLKSKAEIRGCKYIPDGE